jgi:hypothetical protein
MENGEKKFFGQVTFWEKVILFCVKHYIMVKIFFSQYGVDGYQKMQNFT